MSKGTPKRGGQWACKHTGEAVGVELVEVPEAGVGSSAKRAPLERYRITGLTEREHLVAAGTPEARIVAGGTCWHCGQSIKICVQATNRDDGSVIEVGTTCAERIGLDPAGLKRYLADKFAEERHEKSKAGREAARRAAEERERVETAEHGEHGTESRFRSGCRCETCMAVAPHGTPERWRRDRCTCSECLDAAADDGCRTIERQVLVDLSTGRPVPDAKLVSTRYGTSWVVESSGKFVPYSAKRRDTITKRGYTYATVAYLGHDARGDSGPYFVPDAAVSEPCMDTWGQPIRPTAPVTGFPAGRCQ